MLRFDDPNDPWKHSTYFDNAGETAPDLVPGRTGSGISRTPGSDDEARLPNTASLLNMPEFTLSAWVRLRNGGSWGPVDDVFEEWTYGSAPAADTWFHLSYSWTGVVSGSSLRVLVDGEPAWPYSPQGAAGVLVSDAGVTLTLGNRADSGSFPLDGDLDEVWISGVVRSERWVNFQVDVMNESIVSYGPFMSTPTMPRYSRRTTSWPR